MANVADIRHAAWWQACQQKRCRDPQVWLFHGQTIHIRSGALCVFGRHADGWSRTAKTVRRFCSQWCCFLLFLKKSTFLVSFLLSFRWLSVLSHVLNEGINKITDYKCLWSPASPFSFCDRHASRNVVAETVRRGWRFLSVCIVCGRLWQNKGNENHINFTWKPHE